MSQHARRRDSMLLMLGLLHSASAKTMYTNPKQVNRERNASWYYGPLGLDGVEATIAFIGDSTHRNQLQFLCDVLGTQPRDIATGTSSTGLACSSKGITAALKVFDGDSDPWSMRSMRSVLRNLARGAAVKRWDVVYFGSTSLHMLQLLPLIKWRGWPAARDLGRELAKAVDSIKGVGACPVFMTGHWLCSREFLKRRDESEKGEFPSVDWELERLRRFLGDESNAWAARKAAILRIAAKNTSYYTRECSAITSDRDEAAACSKLSFDAAGSAHAAALEQKALSSLTKPVRVVDAHALTRDQCWATQRDGVHYLPLLPSRLSALTAHVVDCLREQRPPFRGFRGTTHIT
jgi:hypothetical protein